jgi:hypothetical protein
VLIRLNICFSNFDLDQIYGVSDFAAHKSSNHYLSSLTRDIWVPLGHSANLQFLISRMELEAIILTHTESQIFVGNRPHRPQDVSNSQAQCSNQGQASIDHRNPLFGVPCDKRLLNYKSKQYLNRFLIVMGYSVSALSTDKRANGRLVASKKGPRRTLRESAIAQISSDQIGQWGQFREDF